MFGSGCSKKVLLFLVVTIMCLGTVVALAAPLYSYDLNFIIPEDKLAYGPATYRKRPAGLGTAVWHCYLKDMDYEIDPGGGFPYTSGDISVYVYSRTIDRQVSGKKSISDLGTAGNVSGGYAYLQSSYVNTTNEYKIVAVKRNIDLSYGGGLIVYFDWQPW